MYAHRKQMKIFFYFSSIIIVHIMTRKERNIRFERIKEKRNINERLEM